MTGVKLSAAQQRTVDALRTAAELLADRGLCPPDMFFQKSRRAGRHTITSAIRVAVTGHELMTGTETPTQQDTVVRALEAFSRLSGDSASGFGEWEDQTTAAGAAFLRAAADEVGEAAPRRPEVGAA